MSTLTTRLGRKDDPNRVHVQLEQMPDPLKAYRSVRIDWHNNKTSGNALAWTNMEALEHVAFQQGLFYIRHHQNGVLSHVEEVRKHK